jgi:hypothetical protein
MIIHLFTAFTYNPGMHLCSTIPKVIQTLCSSAFRLQVVAVSPTAVASWRRWSWQQVQRAQQAQLTPLPGKERHDWN